MAIEFKFLSLSALWTDDKKLPISRTRKRPCFREFLTRFGQRQIDTNYIKIFLVRDESFVKELYNNYCPFTKKEIERYCKLVSSYCKFKYKVTTTKSRNNSTKAFIIHAIITGNRTQALFICTALRYLFEFPYNMYLMEAIKLRKEPEFKWFNTFNLTALINNSSSYFDGGGHSLGLRSNSIYKTKKDIINNILNCTSMNYLFGNVHKNYAAINTNATQYNQWIDENSYKERVKVYIRNLNKFINGRV